MTVGKMASLLRLVDAVKTAEIAALAESGKQLEHLKAQHRKVRALGAPRQQSTAGANTLDPWHTAGGQARLDRWKSARLSALATVIAQSAATHEAQLERARRAVGRAQALEELVRRLR